METLTQLLAEVHTLEETIGVAPNLLLWAVPLFLLLVILMAIPFLMRHKEMTAKFFKWWAISAIPAVIGIFVPNPVGAFLAMPFALFANVAVTAVAIIFALQVGKLMLSVIGMSPNADELPQTYRNGYREDLYRATHGGHNGGVKW